MSDLAIRILKRSAIQLALSVAALGAIASPATALPGGFAWHVDEVTATSSQAGAPADVTVVVATDDDPEEQDLESLTLEWPDGLVPITDPAEYCVVSQGSDGVYFCANPNARKIGHQTMEATVSIFGSEVPVTIEADTYADAPAPGEVARLVSIPTLPVPEVVSIAPVFLRSDGSGINVELDAFPSPCLFESIELPIHMHRIETTTFGTPESTGGPASLTIPAICDPLSFDATFASYGVDAIPQSGDEVSVADSEPFPVTGCDSVPFSPTIALSLSNSQAGARSSLLSTTSATQGNAPTRDLKITIPGFGLAPTTLTPCTAAEVAASACPEHSKLGTITINTPFFSEALSGSVYLAYPREDAVGIEIFLTASYGALRISGTLRQASDGTVELALLDFPPIVGGTVNMDLASGSAGAFQNPWSCGTYTATSLFTSYNNRQVAQTQPLVIGGCELFAQSTPTTLTVSLTKAVANRHTDAKLKVTQQPRSIDSASFVLPADLTVKRRQRLGLRLGYLELWSTEGVRRGTLFAARRTPRSLLLATRNRQLRGLELSVDKTARRSRSKSRGARTQLRLTRVPGDEPLTDFSLQLFGRRTLFLRTFRKCHRSRTLTFRANVTTAGDVQEASSAVRVRCPPKTTGASSDLHARRS